jgi:hypothetical protein
MQSSILPVISFSRFCSDFFGDLLFVEENDFLDGAHAALQVLTHRDDLADDDGRARQRLQHAELAALDALGDFNFAFARQQGNRPHLAQVHADRVVGFFQSAGREVEFHILAGFDLLRISCRARHLSGPSSTSMPCVPMVVSRSSRSSGVHIVRDQVVHLVVGEISLLFTHIDQLFDVVVLVFKSQEVFLKFFNSLARERIVAFHCRWESGVARSCAPSTNLRVLAHKCSPGLSLARRKLSCPPLSLTRY